MRERTGCWIDVYPFQERKISTESISRKVLLSPELSDYCEELWEPKAKAGWKSSWIAFLSSIKFERDNITAYMRSIPFKHVDGINNAIEQKKSFALEQRYVNCLSVGFPTATADSKIIFQRRAPNVHCPNILIHEPCGYMASMVFAPRSNCDKEEYANDPRLFNIGFQLDARKAEIAETFKLEEEAVSYQEKQDFLAAGWKSTEMYFSTTGKIDVKQNDLKIPEGEFFFVPFEHLKELIHNQGKLAQINAENYRPENPTEIPLIDESLVGLIWGYEKLTGEKLDIEETIERLNKEGLDIRVYNTSDISYTFPVLF